MPKPNLTIVAPKEGHQKDGAAVTFFSQLKSGLFSPIAVSEDDASSIATDTPPTADAMMSQAYLFGVKTPLPPLTR